MATGRVLADGIGGPGLTPSEGRAILAADDFAGDRLQTAPAFNGYGCNMAVRSAVVRRHRLRFDERLPLYAWQEDVDFSRRLAPHGAILQLEGARGVHLGVKQGRSPGVQLGYAQVVNPFYLVRKQAGYPMGRALSHVGCNMAAHRGAASGRRSPQRRTTHPGGKPPRPWHRGKCRLLSTRMRIRSPWPHSLRR